MLVLSRRKDETIVMGKDHNIELKVVEIRGDRVRLGIDAPKEVSVLRQEIYNDIQRNYQTFKEYLDDRRYTAARGLLKKDEGLRGYIGRVVQEENSERKTGELYETLEQSLIDEKFDEAFGLLESNAKLRRYLKKILK
tara:strand:- start:28 stop:441 length:414 start_codon:yes stop_codon:yes gene_type:complete